jgi:glycogen operon protein
VIPVRVRAPQASVVVLVRFDTSGAELGSEPLRRDGDDWVGEVAAGTIYGLVAEGDGPRFDASKLLLDPRATEVWFPPGHDRQRARRRGVDTTGAVPLAVARAPRPVQPSQRSSRPPVVYEAHVRGLTKRRSSPLAGTYAGLLEELPRLAALGVTVVELLPLHQNDPQEGSYWGYMPLAFGAVHRQYAAGDDPAGELAAFVAAAHDRDIEVWLDVVFNHTTEVDETGPTYSLRGLSDGSYYRLHDDGSYVETTGCGNDLDAWSASAQDLVEWSLDQFADLGIDGFRFDLAAVLARDDSFVARLERWADRRGVVMVAEPWDAVGTHRVGRAWPGQGWLQWNDRFREDVRGFLRGENGLAEALSLRLRGSPDVFDAPMESVNFITCHDGFTLYDLVAYDRKHNEANGHANHDGSGGNRSWNCGWEGDVDVPDEVVELRHRQLRNAWCLLAMSHGVPLATMGDELGRTQGGNNNAYNQDNETSWVDWERAAGFADLERFVRLLLGVRHRHPVLTQPDWWGDAVQFHGTSGPADLGPHARALAWSIGDLYVIANAWWEPLEFWLQRSGPWRRVVDTSLPSPDDIVEHGGEQIGQLYDVGPRSVVILERAR